MHEYAANGSKPRPASLSSSCPALHSRRLRFPHGHPRFLLLPRRAAPLPRWGLLKHVDMVSTTRNRKKGQDPGKKTWRRNIEPITMNQKAELTSIHHIKIDIRENKPMKPETKTTPEQLASFNAILLLLPWHPRSSPRTWTWPQWEMDTGSWPSPYVADPTYPPIEDLL